MEENYIYLKIIHQKKMMKLWNI